MLGLALFLLPLVVDNAAVAAQPEQPVSPAATAAGQRRALSEGYGLTRWEMSLEEVQRLYPGGAISPDRKGYFLPGNPGRSDSGVTCIETIPRWKGTLSFEFGLLGLDLVSCLMVHDGAGNSIEAMRSFRDDIVSHYGLDRTPNVWLSDFAVIRLARIAEPGDEGIVVLRFSPMTSDGAPLGANNLARRLPHAGYADTNWGMSLQRVSALYPGGHVEREQDGRLSYQVVRSITGLTALLLLRFEGRGLTSVDILFPKEGTDIRPATGTYTPPAREEATTVFSLLQHDLNTKYGPGGLSDAEGKVFAYWFAVPNTLIMLDLVAGPPGQATAHVSFSSRPSVQGL